MPTVIIGENTGDDYSGTEDTELWEANPTTNYSSDTEFYVSSYASGDRRWAALGFSGLSSLSYPITVSSATGYLYHSAAGTVDGNTVRFRKFLVTVVESQATWNIYSTGNSWTTAGALSDGNDRSATTTADFSVGITPGSYKSFSSAQLATDIESSASVQWLGSRASEATIDFFYDQFTGSRGTDGQRPYLSVTYTASSGTWLTRNYWWDNL